MATQTIEQSKESQEASMTTLVAPSQCKTRTVYPEALPPTEAVQRLIQVIGDLEEEKEIAAMAEMVSFQAAVGAVQERAKEWATAANFERDVARRAGRLAFMA